jgi:hypothetical protein
MFLGFAPGGPRLAPAASPRTANGEAKIEPKLRRGRRGALGANPGEGRDQMVAICDRSPEAEVYRTTRKPEKIVRVRICAHCGRRYVTTERVTG